MTNKINGIDVSECPHYDKDAGCFHTLDGKCIKDKCNIYKLILKSQCLQQENKVLRQTRKNSPDIQEPYIYLYRQIKKQCHKLQKENEELKKRQITKNGFICDCEQNAKYKDALEKTLKILCNGKTFYEGYFDTPILSRTDAAIKVINEVFSNE